MRRIRRDPPEARIELNPLIDLMTFLLTFFIYAVVMMVRVDLVPMDLKQFASGKPAKPATAATISVLRTGKIYFNKEEVEMKDVEVPNFWSQVAKDVLAQKYFRKYRTKSS